MTHHFNPAAKTAVVKRNGFKTTSRVLRVLGLLTIVTLFSACNEARDDVAGPDPQIEDVPPFPVSAPQLTLETHPTGWQHADCKACHTTRLVAGHSSFDANRCVQCHGYNRPGEVLCGTCHGVASPEGFPSTGLHRFHVEEKGYDCAICHSQQLHRNGAIEIQMERQGEFVLAFGRSDLPNVPFSAPGCTDVGCHEPRSWREDACETCHESPPSEPIHRLHLSVTEADGGQAVTCRDCHAGNQHDARIDAGIIEVGGADWSEWDATRGDCTTSCHAQTRTWDCTSCHGYPPATGRHRKHAVDYAIPCEVCHADHQHTYRAAMDPMGFADAVKVSFLFQRGEWDPPAQSCLDVGCHEDRLWEE